MSGFLKIIGKKIKGYSLGIFTWNLDLIDFDGPLLSLFKDEKGNDYLFLWLDCDDSFNLWCIIPVERVFFEQYLNRGVSLLDIIKKADVLTVFKLNSKGRRSGFVSTQWSNLPEEYLPAEDSYFYDEIATKAAISLAEDKPEESFLGLDGELYIDDLSTIPKNYQQLYSFHYGLEHLNRNAVRSKLSDLMSKWSGGINAVNLFTGLQSLIPSVHRARVTELKYNSPGHIKISVLPRMARQIEAASEAIKGNKEFDIFELYYKRVYKYFKENNIHGFEKDNGSSNVDLTSEQRKRLGLFVDEFFEMMHWDSYKRNFKVIGANPLQQLRILLAYYRRLRKLRVLVVEGKLNVGASSISNLEDEVQGLID
ncbi:hypothetical protein EHLJMEHL_02183 [Vreelandella titanicae]